MIDVAKQNERFDALEGLTLGQRCALMDAGRVACTSCALSYEDYARIFGRERADDVWGLGDEDMDTDVAVALENPKHFGGHILTVEPLVTWGRTDEEPNVMHEKGWREAEDWAEARGYGEAVDGAVSASKKASDLSAPTTYLDGESPSNN